MHEGSRITVPESDLVMHLRGYRAEALPEYSNDRRHVYFSRPMAHYITVRGVPSAHGGRAMELHFTSDCPCTYDY
jgi:hypothetical protein